MDLFGHAGPSMYKNYKSCVGLATDRLTHLQRQAWERLVKFCFISCFSTRTRPVIGLVNQHFEVFKISCCVSLIGKERVISKTPTTTLTGSVCCSPFWCFLFASLNVKNSGFWRPLASCSTLSGSSSSPALPGSNSYPIFRRVSKHRHTSKIRTHTCLRVFACLCICASVFVPLCLCTCASVPLCLCLCACACAGVCVSVPLCLAVSVPLCLCLCVCASVPLYLCLCVCASAPVPLCLYLCTCA